MSKVFAKYFNTNLSFQGKESNSTVKKMNEIANALLKNSTSYFSRGSNVVVNSEQATSTVKFTKAPVNYDTVAIVKAVMGSLLGWGIVGFITKGIALLISPELRQEYENYDKQLVAEAKSLQKELTGIKDATFQQKKAFFLGKIKEQKGIDIDLILKACLSLQDEKGVSIFNDKEKQAFQVAFQAAFDKVTADREEEVNRVLSKIGSKYYKVDAPLEEAQVFLNFNKDLKAINKDNTNEIKNFLKSEIRKKDGLDIKEKLAHYFNGFFNQVTLEDEKLFARALVNAQREIDNENLLLLEPEDGNRKLEALKSELDHIGINESVTLKNFFKSQIDKDPSRNLTKELEGYFLLKEKEGQTLSDLDKGLFQQALKLAKEMDEE